jgi:hypothetical protein
MRSGDRRDEVPTLLGMARTDRWPTPTAADGGRASETYARGNLTLLGAIKKCPTPTSCDGLRGLDRTKAKRAELGWNTGETLNDFVHRWPTPKGRDSKGRDSKGRADLSLPAAVWATPNARDGKGASSNDRDLTREVGGRLNPVWVEWLMGWPLGWTDCASPVTESFQSWLRAHSASCGDDCTGSAEP